MLMGACNLISWLVCGCCVVAMFQFYSIEFNARRKRDREITEDEERCEGLGGLPQNIGSLSNLLLFNTQENP